MSMLMSVAGFDLRKAAMSCQRAGSTTTVSSPCWAWVSWTASGKDCRSSSTSAFAMSFLERLGRGFSPPELDEAVFVGRDGIGARLHGRRRAIPALDLVHEQHQPIEHGLWPRGAAGDVHVTGDDLVDAG